MDIMNRKQRTLLINFIIVAVFTCVFIFAVFQLRDHVNRKEALFTMEMLRKEILDYKEKFRSLPPESWVVNNDVLDAARFKRGFIYRARWIDYGAGDDTILMYMFLGTRSFFRDGYAVMRLDGTVEWVPKERFEKQLASQQSREEKDSLETVISPF